MPKKLLFTIIILCSALFLSKIVDVVFNRTLKKKKQIHIKFFKNIIQILIIFFGLYTIGMQFDKFQSFSNTILASSSLLVVVLGFAFQKSLEDFIAGILISLFKPFNIDDRVTLMGEKISGYIEDITIRHTVIRTFNNSRLIVPNSTMNKEILENNKIINPQSIGFMDALITYESDVSLAKEVMAKVICSHPNVVDTRTPEEKEKGEPQVRIFVRELGENGIALRGNVVTENIDLNFKTCSDIREALLKEFAKNNIEFAYPHVTISK